ncbi:hypothetical protein ACXR2U_06635 [Jatrophihabitans sp. YIM 134969]
MEDIEMPAVLDAHEARLGGALAAAGDDSARVTLLQSELDAACSYGARLWHELDRARRAFLGALPDPDAPDEPRRFLTAPRGPDDEEGWEAWRSAYAGATAALAGPSGDSGFGYHEAAREAQRRRGVFHAGPRTAELGRRAAEAASQVEAARSAGRVQEAQQLDRSPTAEASPARDDHAPEPSRALPARVVVSAALAAGTAVAGYLLGRRRPAASR